MEHQSWCLVSRVPAASTTCEVPAFVVGAAGVEGGRWFRVAGVDRLLGHEESTCAHRLVGVGREPRCVGTASRWWLGDQLPAGVRGVV